MSIVEIVLGGFLTFLLGMFLGAFLIIFTRGKRR